MPVRIYKFPQLIDAQLRGATVRYADMVRFYFRSGEVRLHSGTGLLRDGNGEQWKGVGKLGKIGPIQAGPSGAAEEMTLQLFGDTSMLANLSEDAEESAGQVAVRYLQFFDMRQRDASGRWVDWQPLDEPFQIFRGYMGPLVVDRPVVFDPGEQLSRTLSVSVVNGFVNRRKPPYAFYSHRDQQSRTNQQDFIFQETSRMADAKVAWPTGLA